MDETRFIEEKDRLEELLDRAGVPQQQRDALAPVIDNMAWQRVKLDDAREAIKNSNIVISYDNGGGQRGLRENPLFKGYINLWRAYMIGLEKFTSYLPKDMQDEVKGNNISVLEQVRKMKKGIV